MRRAASPAASEPRAFLPLTPVELHVLLSLADADRHGYAMIQEIERRNPHAPRLRTGTLYTVLKRMLDAAWVEDTAGGERAGRDDERRRYYRLTADGRAVLQAEARRLESLVALAREKRVLPRGSRLAQERGR